MQHLLLSFSSGVHVEDVFAVGASVQVFVSLLRFAFAQREARSVLSPRFRFRRRFLGRHFSLLVQLEAWVLLFCVELKIGAFY